MASNQVTQLNIFKPQPPPPPPPKKKKKKKLKIKPSNLQWSISHSLDLIDRFWYSVREPSIKAPAYPLHVLFHFSYYECFLLSLSRIPYFWCFLKTQLRFSFLFLVVIILCFYPGLKELKVREPPSSSFSSSSVHRAISYLLPPLHGHCPSVFFYPADT